jgi:hypothetical protein
MLAVMQLDAERGLHLGYGAGQHHGSSFGMLVDDAQVMICGERPDCRDVGRIRTELARKFVPGQVSARAIAAREPTHPVAQSLAASPAQQHAHLDALGRVRWT